MRTVLLVVACLALTGCWKEIHEAANDKGAGPATGRPLVVQQSGRGEPVRHV